MSRFLLLAVAVSAAAAFVWTFWGPSGVKVTEAELGKNWPLTVSEGYVECKRGDAYLFTSDGKTYGLNGFATTFFDTRDLHEIWKKDPRYPGLNLYLNIDPLFKIAKGLC
ncbi:DUF2511 domain-containing protein [Sulfitobacter pseudonitzschiae]|uniref:DUF2511 domain-containing protein n=1 Tax=Pseudosulfitobacter pseudonitzschiae TaxID=1402135 RepID=A0A9Q2NKM7_9RHOB|nr:DUF2511 domain-containing protein [Pseudosulfitobacter pseudonitzschiae]MBM2293738.1 DUF2511 domain-containing protein [Pseudosulfitobacter pseudonitzschiae]MBM2298656.1 DUF2511 domain-containing protein [Pseudosulfitobacter pseudonitzschiae]MBM2303570.1 DUF2511 domain-containing protein [Pseudosulfitobacter pseudonitzschiae]MBM2313353.1 DUF2511 domain-containing protein [Pseudosulfitobacter pseudonitzschiae]MBM2318266.1 DUF2511 domain-containing protein [Pseudosulfitobacter pseudonitzschia